MQDEINAICAKAGLSLDNVIADLNEILEKCKQSGNMSEALKGLRLSLEVLGTIGSKSTIQVNTQVNLKTDSLDLIRQRLEQRFKTDPVNRAEVIDVNSNTTEESITGTNQPKVS